MDFQKFDALNRQYEDIQERLRSNAYEDMQKKQSDLNEDGETEYKRLLKEYFLSKILSYNKKLRLSYEKLRKKIKQRRIFIIRAKDGNEFAYEYVLDHLLCGACHGAVRKISHEKSLYHHRDCFILQCQNCKGEYKATSLTDDEQRRFKAMYRKNYIKSIFLKKRRSP